MKRTVQVNVKMSPEDFKLMTEAADKKWPDAVMTNSGIVLALAKIAARDILGIPSVSSKERKVPTVKPARSRKADRQ